jgi:hypothetical protein|tara:strand:+ start:1821 stop:2075 length:255 start_codon:yes stop_codon:yes gene_type:complete
MTILTTFILVGMIDSHDAHFATVELNTTPASNGGPATAVMPVAAFPCEIYEGKVFYVVKLHDEQDATIVCQKDVESGPVRRETD